MEIETTGKIVITLYREEREAIARSLDKLDFNQADDPDLHQFWNALR